MLARLGSRCALFATALLGSALLAPSCGPGDIDPTPGVIDDNPVKVPILHHVANEASGFHWIAHGLAGVYVLLLAFDEHTFDVAWEFRDGGKFKGPLVKGSKRVYLTGSKGGVYQFR